MTFTVNPWVVIGVLWLALFGVAFWWRVARGWVGDVWEWWRRDRVTPLLEDDAPCGLCGSVEPCEHDDMEELPPERSWEEMTASQPIIVDRVTLMGPAERAFWSELEEFGPHGMLRAERERRASWWEAEHRAAYEAMGLEYPSGLMARVREAAP